MLPQWHYIRCFYPPLPHARTHTHTDTRIRSAQVSVSAAYCWPCRCRADTRLWQMSRHQTLSQEQKLTSSLWSKEGCFTMFLPNIFSVSLVDRWCGVRLWHSRWLVLVWRERSASSISKAMWEGHLSHLFFLWLSVVPSAYLPLGSVSYLLGCWHVEMLVCLAAAYAGSVASQTDRQQWTEAQGRRSPLDKYETTRAAVLPLTWCEEWYCTVV